MLEFDLLLNKWGNLGKKGQKKKAVTLSPCVSSFIVTAKRVRLYLVGYLEGLLRFHRNWGSNNEFDPLSFLEPSPIT